jgi:hypothetical protein
LPIFKFHLYPRKKTSVLQEHVYLHRNSCNCRLGRLEKIPLNLPVVASRDNIPLTYFRF